MKGKVSKVITLLITIGLILMMLVMNNVIPIKVSKDVLNIEQQQEAGMESLR